MAPVLSKWKKYPKCTGQNDEKSLFCLTGIQCTDNYWQKLHIDLHYYSEDFSSKNE